MIDKNDPLIGVVQGVMNRNHAEREAAKLVNEKFGIEDRKVLPHERQHEWETAYQTVLKEGVEALDEKSFAALAPPYDKATQKDRLVGAGVLKKHPTQPGKHVLAKEESLDEKLVGKQSNIDVASTNGEKKPDGKLTSHDFKHLRSMKEGSDVTSPSSMGIKKPDYAPAGTTPDYAKPKEQTVNRAAKTSLPTGTVAKSIKEEMTEAEKAKRENIVMSMKKKMSGFKKRYGERAKDVMYATATKQAMKEAADSASSMPQVKGQSKYGSAPQQVSYGNIPAVAKAKQLASSGSGVGTAMSGFKPSSSAATKPSTQAAAPAPTGPRGPAGGSGAVTRPSSSTPARTNPGITKLNADSAARQQAAKIGNQTGGVNTKANAPTPAAKPMGAGAAGQQVGAPKAPIPRIKPTVAKPATKPAATKPTAKVTPVRKAAPAPAVAKAKGTPASRMQSRYERDGGNVGPKRK